MTFVEQTKSLHPPCVPFGLTSSQLVVWKPGEHMVWGKIGLDEMGKL